MSSHVLVRRQLQFFLSCALALIEILRKRIRLRAAEMTTFSGSPLLPEPLRFSFVFCEVLSACNLEWSTPFGVFLCSM